MDEYLGFWVNTRGDGIHGYGLGRGYGDGFDSGDSYGGGGGAGEAGFENGSGHDSSRTRWHGNGYSNNPYDYIEG